MSKELPPRGVNVPGAGGGDVPGDGDRDEPWSWKAAAPFLIAFGVVVVLVIVLVLSGIFRPAEERRPDEWKIQNAINAVYESQSSVDWDNFHRGFCPKVTGAAEFPSAEEFREDNRRETDAHGKYVIDISDIEVDGDTATAKVRVTRKDAPGDQKPAETPLEMVKIDGDWKVCTLP